MIGIGPSLPSRIPFGAQVDSSDVQALFHELGTLRRPALPEDDEYICHDWVLIRRKGVELGFTDSQYQQGGARSLWRHGDLILTQVYFYAGQPNVEPYRGELPFGLVWSDDRNAARAKLHIFESTLHSHVSDTWDVGNYRLTVAYLQNGLRIDRIACRMLPAPMPQTGRRMVSRWQDLVAAFGETLRSRAFQALWPLSLTEDDVLDVEEDGELDLRQTFGATLAFVPSTSGPTFRSITLHRERDLESVGWRGELPHSLSFEDDPSTLFGKLARHSRFPPVQHRDASLTGHAVWHFEDHTLHVLYSNVDNRLLRIKLIAPGTWKCVEEDAADSDC
jgi:hypothetical protein